MNKLFKIGKLFKVNTTKRIFNANDVTRYTNKGYPYVVRRNFNNGTRNRLVEPIKYLNPGNTISFGQDSTAIFYQKIPYFTSDKVKVLTPQFNGFDENVGLYIVTAMKKAFILFSWGEYKFNKKVIRNMSISLPATHNGELNLKVMRQTILDIKSKYISLLNKLISHKMAHFNVVNANKPKMVKIPMKSLFKIKHTSKFNKNALNDNTKDYDYITRTTNNQGVEETTGFIDNKHLNPKGVFSLGLQQMTFFYRPREWYAGQFIREIIPNFKLNKYRVIYFESLFNKIRPLLKAEIVRNVDKKFLNMNIMVPMINNKLDTTYIDNFVKKMKLNQLNRLYKIINK